MDANKIFGIVNVGNTCYMNSIVQLLFNIKPLSDTLLRTNTDNMILQNYKKILQYRKNNTSKKIVKLENFCNQIFQDTYFERGQQHDAHEFLYVILDIIHEQIKNNVIITYDNYNDNKIHRDCETEWKKFCKDNYSVVIPTFYGQIRVEKTCVCQYTSIVREQVCGITLQVKHGNMENALHEYFSNSIINDYKCEKCEQVQDIVQKKSIEILPDFMIVQLNRFTGHGYHKNNQIFGFSQSINIGNYVESTFAANNIKYELDAIICHYGSIISGHYNVILKHQGKWFYVDDEIVHKMRHTINNNIIRNAYLLVYKRV